jgi:hypothetical protein
MNPFRPPIRRARTGARLLRLVLVLLGLVSFAEPPLAAERSGKPTPGAYCPLPEKGQKPVCLSPAEARYEEFFQALERGEVDDRHTAAVEADLQAGTDPERAYLALSSVSYGYYRLADRVGSHPEADPALLARLSHWNRLLLEVYGETGGDSDFRQAVREAAVDLHRRTPAAGELCARSHSVEGECPGADGLVRALAQIDSNAGIRAPLSKLMNRVVGRPTPNDPPTRPASGNQ